LSSVIVPEMVRCAINEAIVPNHKNKTSTCFFICENLSLKKYCNESIIKAFSDLLFNLDVIIAHLIFLVEKTCLSVYICLTYFLLIFLLYFNLQLRNY
jgi:hypothetical protein